MIPKTWITYASLAANGVFVVVWTFAPLSTEVPKMPKQVSSAKSAALENVPFHWSQIEADDFPSFIQNLRGIGCPEATIQSIVHEELTLVYAAKRQALETAGAVPGDAPEARIRFQKLEEEKNAVLAGLMAPPPSALSAIKGSNETTPVSGPTSPHEISTAPGIEAVAPPPVPAVMVPAAFAVGNDPQQSPGTTDSLSLTPNDPTLDPVTSRVISDLRSKFAQSVQSASTDPSSKTYLQSWMSAQKASDERFSSMFGGDVFVRTQIRAAQEAAAAARAQAVTPP